MKENKNIKHLTVGACIARPQNKNQQGITLIALIITIIVMLILAGVALNLTIGERGIFKTAQNAQEEHIKSQLKEELELGILDIETDKITKGQEMKREDLAELGNIGATMENYGIPAEGEYKDYYFEVDENYVVTIIGKLKGEKPTINAEILTEGIVTPGGKVEIKVTARISEGKITKIEATNGAVLKTETSLTEKIFEVSANGTYYFKVIAENGRSAIASIEVNTIIEKPVIEATNITNTKITVTVKNNYLQGMKYTYYLDGVIKEKDTELNSYTIENLTENTKYKIKVKVTYNNINLESDEIEVTTFKMPNMPKINATYDESKIVKTELEYPILTTNGVMNCEIKPEQGSSITIELYNTDIGVTNYYTLDGGITWNKYTGPIKTIYNEEGKIQAKSVNNVGIESDINILKNYEYDSTKECTANDHLSKLAYDNDYTTYTNCDTNNSIKNKLIVDPECWGKYITLYTHTADGSGYGCISFCSSTDNNSKFKGGYLRTLSGDKTSGRKTAKSVKIPQNTKMIYLNDGTSSKILYYVYEVKCTCVDLSGTEF